MSITPYKIGTNDSYKKYTFKGNERVCGQTCKCAVAVGMKKGDALAALAHNCVEGMELRAAAKDDFITVLIITGFPGPELPIDTNHNGCKVFVAQGGVDKNGSRNDLRNFSGR